MPGQEDLQQKRGEVGFWPVRGKDRDGVRRGGRACGKLICAGETPATATPIPIILQSAW